MIISLNWLKQFVAVDVPVDELVTLIGARLVEVEEVVSLADKYKGAVIVKVVREQPHPSADKLHVVHIDDGGVTPGVTRLADGLVEVVCGAPNVRAGITAVWLPPGATVPSTFSDAGPIILEARPLRGVVSNGMLASARELGVGEEHDGIVEVEIEATPGTGFAHAYALDDYLIDIENKSLTHRPDCFGLIGFAREIAAIQGKAFTTPEWLLATTPQIPLPDGITPVAVTATVADPNVSARYQVIALDGVDAAKASPFAMQTWLARVGIRPISAVVDVTNYLMYLTGQPLHAFDLDKVLAVHPEHKAEIIVRESRQGETLELLDGRTITLADDDIVICAGSVPIALAGAMGGASTEIDSSTKRVLLESATFDLFRLRTTQMRHGIFSEAITRFTKGQSAVQTAPVLASAVALLSDLTGAAPVSDIVDTLAVPFEPSTVAVEAQQISAILGAPYSLEAIAETLRRVEFAVEQRQLQTADQLLVTVPYWRADIHIIEDIAEEIGRINGFDDITPELPLRPFAAVMPSVFEQTRSRVRRSLVRGGANEVLTYNFIPGQLLEKAGETTEQAYRLVNSLSPELACLRTSLLPSLLSRVHANHKLGYGAFALFEMNKTHSRLETESDGRTLPALPVERPMLALVLSVEDKLAGRYDGAPYYQAKQYLDMLAASLSVSLRYEPLVSAAVPSWLKLRDSVYEPKRAAMVYAGDVPLGLIGEVNGRVRSAMKLPQVIAGFEIDLALLDAARSTDSSYTPLGRYQGTTRDVSLRVPAGTPYADVLTTVQAVLAATAFGSSVEPQSIYQKPEDKLKTITLRIALADPQATIKAEAANDVVARIAETAKEKLRAELV
ncbi:phenylalanine--tRNA ligase subunit beta [Candidatus Saccharibacteria bacterium]|nr:phenylalanine--tRNA ligase subunit beta [Candidatus Saccharibacteria bacterium]